MIYDVAIDLTSFLNGYTYNLDCKSIQTMRGFKILVGQ